MRVSDPKETQAAYFCPETGIRLVKPGKHKSVDPENGIEAYDDAARRDADRQAETIKTHKVK